MFNLKNKLNLVIAEAERDKQPPADGLLDKKVIAVILLIPFCLTMIEYIGQYRYLRSVLLTFGASDLASHLDVLIYGSYTSNLGILCYWVSNLVLFYFVIPAAVIHFLFKENLSDYGLNVKGAFKDYYLYILMLFVMIPLVLYFSGTSGFQARYPFFKVYSGNTDYADLWKWELLYCAQFFALEFFFRGFVLFGLKPKLGFYSVFVMTIPYCMIHFGKPLPETLAAIIAGIVLGTLSLKNRSIWLGCLIHCSVGISMDLASLWQRGWH